MPNSQQDGETCSFTTCAMDYNYVPFGDTVGGNPGARDVALISVSLTSQLTANLNINQKPCIAPAQKRVLAGIYKDLKFQSNH